MKTDLGAQISNAEAEMLIRRMWTISAVDIVASQFATRNVIC